MSNVKNEEILVFDDDFDNNFFDIDDKFPTDVSVASDENNAEFYYSELLHMFPNIDANYIKEICIDPPFDTDKVDNHFEMLINHLLVYNDRIDEQTIANILKDQEEFSKSNTSNDEMIALQYMEAEQEDENTLNDHVLSEMLEIEEIESMEQQKQNEQQLNEQLFSEFLERDQEMVNEKMEILVNILPDADPDFLKKCIKEHDGNIDSLQQFVESKLLDKNYEKRDQYYAKLQIKQKIEEYTVHFNVAKFIKLFSDPFDHFESAARKCTFQEKAVKFLKNRYNSYPAQEVERVYSASNNNLSLADKHLQRLCPMDPTVYFNIDTDDTLLLQEIAFIQNKVSIREQLELIQRRKEKEMKILRAQKLLLVCQCCYDDMNPIESVECNKDKNHIFCIECIVRGTQAAISEGETSVRCFKGCDVEIPLNVLKKVLPLSIYDVLINKRQEIEVKAALNEDLVTCPFCPYSMELSPEIIVFTCKNPQCMKITCRLCKKKHHLPIKCEDVLDEHKGRLFVEEAMSKALIRYCHKCTKPFVKLDGCNKMQCPCGAMMCYICKKPISGYSHFDSGNGCRTYSDSRAFDQQQVELGRIVATTRLHQDFPDLQIPKV